jgi:hypothetical protein
MEFTISVVIAYLWSGVSEVMKLLGSDIMNKPMWARQPTIWMIILVTSTWPFFQFINKAYPYSSRAVAFASFSIIWQMGVATCFVWCCIIFSGYIFDSTVLRVITTSILFVVGALFVLPLFNFLMIPLTLLISWPLDLLFPQEKESKISKTENDQKVEHTGISNISTTENELKNKKGN